MDRVAELLPSIDRSGQAVGARPADHSVGGHPGHDLGVGEIPARPAHFPKPVIGVLPMALEVGQQCHLEFPGALLCADRGLPGQVQHIEDLTPYVELQLVGGGVAGAHRRRFLITA
jgi:hypothetical protein